MSVQTSELAPATRVASRKLGPTRGSGSPSASARAACETSTLASTCGRWLTAASSRSCVAASIATGRAPEEVRARVLHPAGLGPGHGVAAHETLVVDGLHERALGGAHVAHNAVGT